MSKNENYIWVYGENHGSTADNNSYFFWKHVVNIQDGIDKYIVFDKNEKTQKAYNNLSNYEKKFVIWKNSKKHHELYDAADMFFVTLSYKDITPTKLYFKEITLKVNKPVVYLRHGTTGMKRTDYNGKSYWNNMFRFLSYNPDEPEYLIKYNNFKKYQVLSADFHPRYTEFVKKDQEFPKDQLLWFITWREYFGVNTETKVFINYLKNVLKSKELREYLKKNELVLKLCVHQFFDEITFKDIYKLSKEGVIEIVHSKDINVMDELTKSKLLITDYSSVAYDFSFLDRPVLLYQPDLEVYNRYREFFCDIEEMQMYNISKSKDLVDIIVNEKYEVNPFFRRNWPENIDYEQIKQGKHIDEIYAYFANMQKNKITILGLNFYEHDETVNTIMSLAEDLLQKEYLVNVVSLYRRNRKLNPPLGLNMRSLYWRDTPSRRERITRKMHSSKGNYKSLKYDSRINLFHPSNGYYLNELIKNIHAKTVISTRESIHPFLDKCKSKLVENKVYFFAPPTEYESENYQKLMDEIKKIDIEKSIFVNEEDIKFFKNNLDFETKSPMILKTNIIEDQMAEKININSEFVDENYNLKEIEPEIWAEDKELKAEYKLLNQANIEKKEKYIGLCFANVDKYYMDDLKNIIEFGNYLKENKIENIKLDVIGKGDYSLGFLKLIAKNDLFDYVTYLGSNFNRINEIRRHDFVVDLTKNPNQNINYLQGVLNYRKVFCLRNSISEEVFKDIPNTFIESHEWLCEQISNLDKINLKELDGNYNTVKEECYKKNSGEELLDYLK